MLRGWIAATLLAAGRRVDERGFVLLDAALGYLALGRWLQRRGIGRVRQVAGRDQLFELALPSLRGQNALYVELGVHKGDSMRWWVNNLQDQRATFHGFDSFVGLPENWNEENPMGRFSTQGDPPDIEDARVEFFPGWFEETLPGYRPPAHGVTFITFDADLYSSTSTALTHLRPLITRGTWLYFDELNDKDHELRALDEFLQATGLNVCPIARARNGRHWLFRVE